MSRVSSFLFALSDAHFLLLIRSQPDRFYIKRVPRCLPSISEGGCKSESFAALTPNLTPAVSILIPALLPTLLGTFAVIRRSPCYEEVHLFAPR
jgi:hypothetical protein